MTYPETVSYLMAHGHSLNMMPGDGIVDEMIILRDSVLPYLDQHSHTISDQMTALATIFRSCSKHAATYEDCEQLTLWKRMEEMYIAKNADYGDSWSQELDMFGIICMRIRAFEKLNRIISITQNGAKVLSEKVSDTLQDICNYCVMTAMWSKRNA